MRLGDALVRAAGYLEGRGIDTPRLDAELLFARALGFTRLDLYLHYDRPLHEDELAAARELVRRRGNREPAAYVLGEWGFRRLTLAVDPRVLVPRPETESVVERCLELLHGIDAPEVLDVGTGSGAIALAIADEHPGARVTAIDASAEALEVARANAERLGFDVRFELRDVRDGLAGSYDLVVSNPPYVAEEELEGLEPEVRDWEPRLALADDGTTDVVAAKARDALRPGGHLVLEIHERRAEAVTTVMERLGYEQLVVFPDLSGRARGVQGRWGLSTTR